MKKVASILFGSSFLFIAPHHAFATHGYFSHGYGAISKSLGGVGAAYSQDTFAPAINPAGLVWVDDALDIDLSLFSPRRSYEVSGQPSLATQVPGVPFPLGQGKVGSHKNYFVIPYIGWKKQIGEQCALGLAVVGQGGMNTAWPGDNMGTFYGGRLGVDLAQASILGTYAHSFANDRFAVGISPTLLIQRFKINGVSTFSGFSADPANMSDRGHEITMGYGAIVGVQAKITPTLRVGGGYKTISHMDKFDHYSGLFAEQGGFDILSAGNVGIAWQFDPAWWAEFDVVKMWYSDVDSVHDPLLPNLLNTRFGDNNGPGFGWQDVTAYKFGLQYESCPHWIIRGGVSYGKQPIPESEVLLNIIAPGVQEWHFTTGFSYLLDNHQEFKLALMYSPSKSVSGPNPLNLGQTIELKMHQYELTLGYKF